MTRTIVHIGAHKTGSSFLQHFLSANRDRLVARGVDFPGLTGPPVAKAHFDFANHFRKPDPDMVPVIEAAIAAGLSALPVCILSTENFYHCPDPGLVRAAVGPGSCAVCYLRDPLGHLISMWKQGVKSKSVVHGPAEIIDWNVRSLHRGTSGIEMTDAAILDLLQGEG